MSTTRYLSAQMYLLKLVECYNLGWKKSFESIGKKDSLEENYITKLALIHPVVYATTLTTNNKSSSLSIIQEKIQGKRSFSMPCDDLECSCDELWGYECPLKSEPLVMDHDFPYSLGGPTNNAQNKRVLCRWHNMIKGNDIHIYNWENLFEEINFSQENQRLHWIDEQINKVKFEINV